MEPGKDYKFKGNRVTEYPLYQQGGKVVNLPEIDVTTPRGKAYRDSLNLYLAGRNYHNQLIKNLDEIDKMPVHDVLIHPGQPDAHYIKVFNDKNAGEKRDKIFERGRNYWDEIFSLMDKTGYRPIDFGHEGGFADYLEFQKPISPPYSINRVQPKPLPTIETSQLQRQIKPVPNGWEQPDNNYPMLKIRFNQQGKPTHIVNSAGETLPYAGDANPYSGVTREFAFPKFKKEKRGWISKYTNA